MPLCALVCFKGFAWRHGRVQCDELNIQTGDVIERDHSHQVLWQEETALDANFLLTIIYGKPILNFRGTVAS